MPLALGFDRRFASARLTLLCDDGGSLAAIGDAALSGNLFGRGHIYSAGPFGPAAAGEENRGCHDTGGAQAAQPICFGWLIQDEFLSKGQYAQRSISPRKIGAHPSSTVSPIREDEAFTESCLRLPHGETRCSEEASY